MNSAISALMMRALATALVVWVGFATSSGKDDAVVWINKLELREAATRGDLAESFAFHPRTDVAGLETTTAGSEIEKAFDEITRGSSSLEYENRTALSWVLMHNNEGVQALLESVATTAQFTLATAADKGYIDTAIHSLDKGASPDTTDPFGTPSLHLAASAGHTEVVQLLLDRGAAPDKRSMVDGTSALSAAAEQGHSEVVAALLEAGASAGYAEAKDKATPLHRAVWNEHIEAVRSLVSHGAPLDSTDKRGHSPLLYAAIKRNVDIMELLLVAGADVSVLVVSDEPAMAAAEVVQLFVSEGQQAFANIISGYLRDVVGEFELPEGLEWPSRDAAGVADSSSDEL